MVGLNKFPNRLSKAHSVVGEKEILAMAANETDKGLAKYDQGANGEQSGNLPKRRKVDVLG